MLGVGLVLLLCCAGRGAGGQRGAEIVGFIVARLVMVRWKQLVVLLLHARVMV